ncbi:MAG TPA: GNAT family N-acetyltransferase [Candidatus Dormibacteraeota bacterium]|nr:GNAT family N-acetyltransferase [Candidatus Dormibacteraeota bacterium]
MLIEFRHSEKIRKPSEKSISRGVTVELNLDDVDVTHNEEARRFEAAVDGLLSLITYSRFPDRIVLLHTEVPPPLVRKGIAAKLMRTALDFARANQLRVVPLCPYASSFLGKHREFQDLVSADDLQKILSR